MPGAVKESERALVKFKRYSPRVARLQKHFLKSFQFLYRPRNRWILFAYVELSNFSSGALAGIGHRKAHSYETVVIVVVFLKPGFQEAVFLAVAAFLTIVFLLSRLDIEIGVSERRVGQSEAKRELRVDTIFYIEAAIARKDAFSVDGCVAGGIHRQVVRVVGVCGIILKLFLEGKRQFARRVNVTEKDLGQRKSAILTREDGVHQAWDLVNPFLNTHAAAAVQTYHRVRVGRRHLLD